jgi:hypothetical protein
MPSMYLKPFTYSSYAVHSPGVVEDCWWDKWQPTVNGVEMGAESCMPKHMSIFQMYAVGFRVMVCLVS